MLPKVRSNWSLRLMSLGLTLVGTTKRREEASHLTTGEITPHVQMKQMGEILHKAVAPVAGLQPSWVLLGVPLPLLGLVHVQGHETFNNSRQNTLPSFFFRL